MKVLDQANTVEVVPENDRTDLRENVIKRQEEGDQHGYKSTFRKITKKSQYKIRQDRSIYVRNRKECI